MTNGTQSAEGPGVARTVSSAFIDLVRSLCLPQAAPWHTDTSLGGGMSMVTERQGNMRGGTTKLSPLKRTKPGNPKQPKQLDMALVDQDNTINDDGQCGRSTPTHDRARRCREREHNHCRQRRRAPAHLYAAPGGEQRTQ